MNTRYHAIAGFLILLIGLLAPTALLAQEMVIESASPSEAEQGTANLYHNSGWQAEPISLPG